MYYNVQEALAEKITPPNLVVYLRANTSTLMRRITQRDRPYERTMESAYIEQLNRSYDDYYLGTSRNSSVLVIQTDELDFVSRQMDFDIIKARIDEALLEAPFQPQLPIA